MPLAVVPFATLMPRLPVFWKYVVALIVLVVALALVVMVGGAAAVVLNT